MTPGYVDLTGRFNQRSSRGNTYILVGYHYDANVILAVVVKARKASTLTAAWKILHQMFEHSRNAPIIHVLDNEQSKELTGAFEKGVTYQLAPPNNHKTNLAEKAIQTHKSHFKTGLITFDPSFSLSEWDTLIKQSVNLLRFSRMYPNILAYHYLFGAFDFRTTPLVPPEIKVIARLKPEQRES